MDESQLLDAGLRTATNAAAMMGHKDTTDKAGVIIQNLFKTFLETFSSQEQEPEVGSSSAVHVRAPVRDYVDQLVEMQENDRTTMYVDFHHVLTSNEHLADGIEAEYYRFEQFLRKAVQLFVKDNAPDWQTVNPDSGVEREFFVSFFHMPLVHKLRELKTDKIGRLVSMSGTVTRTSEVRPELIYGSFKCMECETRVKDVEQQFRYTEPTSCPNANCTNKTQWHFEVSESKFVDWQRVRVQENSSEIPPGSMPRSIDIICRNDTVENAKAGDKVVFTGVTIVTPDVSQLGVPGDRAESIRQQSKPNSVGGFSSEGVTGLKALGVRELTYKLSFLASSVQTADARFGVVNIRDDDEEVDDMTDEDRAEIQRMMEQPRIYQRLVNSIAPNVFGHDEIKRGILLMLFGGVHKQTEEGINLRGDINVCIVGDPSTAKSQFLKYVVSFLPRAVYTSGKSSSAAGLTASVTRDPDTNEFCIEAGALMLADNGICCIDEFDKMDQKDQVAIHEAMEQQTISIAKAGIQATLNARASVLAAANPQGGRYDRSKTLKANVQMTPAVMSRFDLFFVIVDECDEVADINIAKHIVSLHQHNEVATGSPDFTTSQLQRYIKFSRKLKPRLTPAAKELLVSYYRRLRQGDATGSSKSAYRITVRQLESLVRLSEALARLHCDDDVKPSYVKEAARLLKKSIIHVDTEDVMISDDEEPEEVRDEDETAGGDAAMTDPPAADEADEDAADTTRTRKKRKAERVSEAAEKEDGAAAAGDGVGDEEEPPAKKAMPITYEQYRRICILLTSHLRRHEEAEEMEGMKQADLVQWYLEQEEGRIESEEQLVVETRLVSGIIKRLVEKDEVLVVLQNPEPDAKGRIVPSERVLSVHPNFQFEADSLQNLR